MTTTNGDVRFMSDAQLRSIEADRSTDAETWRLVIAELARRQGMGSAQYTPVSDASSAPVRGSSHVVLAGVDVPFWDLVMLLVKLAIAAIPAMIIVFLVVFVGSAIIVGTFGAAFHR